ncbi:MAG: nucleotide exchange factor GrpE [Peptococcaceae bacterium]|jgi:molecular chaperone GrpE|nr:nucleotide exchange factor GrpE [Peptococcaceae bacterium]
MRFDLSFLNRPRGKESHDPLAEGLARVEEALKELTGTVSQVTKGQFQLTALVESQAETLEETAGNINEGLARAGEQMDTQVSREQEEKALAVLLREFLPVLDGLDRILEFVNQNQEITRISFGPSLVEGLKSLADRAAQALAALGVKRLPATGRPFDPHRHHAVKAVPVTDPELDGRVLQEVMAGYEMRGRVVRYASVVVAVRQEDQER